MTQTTVLAALTAALLCAGCNGNKLEAPQNAPRTVATAVTKADDKGDSGILIQAGSGSVRLGGDCQQHSQCDLPLRCQDYTCSVPPAVDGVGAETAPRVILNAGAPAERVVPVELAETSRERQIGLMFRTRMHPDWGMLFIFERPDARSFWMRNTYLPLDMVFFSDDGTVINTRENAQPLNEGPRYTSTAPARFVLELNAGYVERYGIKAGQRVKLQDVPGEDALGAP